MQGFSGLTHPPPPPQTPLEIQFAVASHYPLKPLASINHLPLISSNDFPWSSMGISWNDTFSKIIYIGCSLQ